jgi:NAD(P)H-hydrate epimerase
MSEAWSDPPRIAAAQTPAVTADQMREVDRAMVEDLHIELIQMMENAGRNLADLAQWLFAPTGVTVLAGGGGNGGGGLVAARHLANRGVAVAVTLASSENDLAPVTLHQLDVLRRMGASIASDPTEAALVIDALIGYSLRGNPAGRAAELIEWANRQPAPVLSLDAPSGLDVTTGSAGRPCVMATATLTLALPKTGLLVAPEQVGRLFLADISVPRLVFERMGLPVGDLFALGPVVEVGS